jgi:hypothetical protein
MTYLPYNNNHRHRRMASGISCLVTEEEAVTQICMCACKYQMSVSLNNIKSYFIIIFLNFSSLLFDGQHHKEVEAMNSIQLLENKRRDFLRSRTL